jgi:hypothetical protein
MKLRLLGANRLRAMALSSNTHQPTLDPDYVSVAEYEKETRAGRAFAPGRITPARPAGHSLTRGPRLIARPCAQSESRKASNAVRCVASSATNAFFAAAA